MNCFFLIVLAHTSRQIQRRHGMELSSSRVEVYKENLTTRQWAGRVSSKSENIAINQYARGRVKRLMYL